MGIITPLSEQLTKPLPNAIVLVNLKELSTGAHKLLPEGCFFSPSPSPHPSVLISLYTLIFMNWSIPLNSKIVNFPGTRLVVSLRGDEPYEELEILKDIDATMILHELPFSEEKVSRIHAARRYLLVRELHYYLKKT